MSNPYGADPSRFTVIPRVLVIATRGDYVLLLQRSPQKRLWPGRYNAPGGHVERGETPLEAAQRELHEETGLRAERMRLRGLLIGDAVGALPGVMVFIYQADVQGQLHAHNAEGVPHWVARSGLEALPTLPDLPLIFHHVLDLPGFFYIYKIPKADGDEDIRIVRVHEEASDNE